MVKSDQPYIVTKKRVVVVEERKYNPNYGDDRTCKCGHPYYRHFDTYEDMSPVGCKYCQCRTFIEIKEGETPHEIDHYDAERLER